MLSVFLDYSINCAHTLPLLPDGHKCKTVHGHRYDIRIEISGAIDAQGWIIEYDQARSVLDDCVMSLDHKMLNEIEGLGNPTCELIVYWLKQRIERKLPSVSLIEVRETNDAGCIWRQD